MKIKSKLLSLLLVLSVLVGLMPNTTAYASGISAPGNATSNAILNSEALIMDVTVPTSVLIHVDAAGEVTTPDHLPIINNSVAPIFVHSLSVNTLNGWTLDPITTDYTNHKVNQKNYWLSFNGLDPSSKPIALATPISGSDTFNLVLSAGVAPQKTAINALNIGEIIITLDWDAAEGAENPVEPGDSGGSGEMPNYYVLAEDSDWAGEADGEFTYIGSNPYVAIPHEIKGVSVTSYESMFRDTAVTGVYSDNPNITTTKAMLRGTSVEEVLLETSNVTDMSQMFGQVEVNELDLSKLDTSKVKDFQHMFWDAKVPALDLSNFDTSSAETLSYMFTQTVTNELDLSSFNIPETADIDFMFGSTPVTTGYAKTQEDADRLNNSFAKPEHLTFVVKGEGDGGSGDNPDYDDPDFNLDDYPDGYVMSKNSDWQLLNAWQPLYKGNDDYPIIPETINGVELTGLDMAFGQGWNHPIKGVYVDNKDITQANLMFKDLDSPTLDLNYINIPNATKMQDMFNNTKATTLDLSSWNISNLHSAERMFKDSAATNIVLSGLDFKGLNQATSMFENTKASTIKINRTEQVGSNMVVQESMFKNSAAKTIDLSEFIATPPSETHPNVTNNMFAGAQATTLYARNRDDAAIYNASLGMPAGLRATIKGQPALPEGYVLAVDSDFGGDFDGEFKFAYRKGGYDQELQRYLYGQFDKFVLPSTIKGVPVTSYRSMMYDWYYQGDGVNLPTHFKSSNSAVTDTSYMFQGYPTATLNLDINTANVTNMSSMFSGAEATTLDLTSFNTTNVTDMSSMFRGAEATTIDLSTFDTTAVTTMESMFQDSKATTIDISTFNLAETQSEVRNIFKDAEATTVYVGSQDDIDYITTNNSGENDIPDTLNFIIK